MATKKIIDEIIEDDVIEEIPEEVQMIEEIIEEKPSKKSNKELDSLVKGRGFASYDKAVEYASSEAFKKLHSLDQDEFNNWLKNIK